MRKSVLKLSVASLIAVIVAACQASIATDGCSIFSPIYGSKQDTAGTRSQVDAHNAKGVGACGWKP